MSRGVRRRTNARHVLGIGYRCNHFDRMEFEVRLLFISIFHIFRLVKWRACKSAPFPSTQESGSQVNAVKTQSICYGLFTYMQNPPNIINYLSRHCAYMCMSARAFCVPSQLTRSRPQFVSSSPFHFYVRIFAAKMVDLCGWVRRCIRFCGPNETIHSPVIYRSKVHLIPMYSTNRKSYTVRGALCVHTIYSRLHEYINGFHTDSMNGLGHAAHKRNTISVTLSAQAQACSSSPVAMERKNEQKEK